jgi:DNA invertase Pin-like site-specific DNA recombinase
MSCGFAGGTTSKPVQCEFESHRGHLAGVLAGLAELELELGKERRTAARDARRARGQSIGRPKALTDEKVALARRLHGSGESATTIATTLGVSRATAYRVRVEDDD